MASRGKKIFIGVGIGCLSIVLLVVASCTGFFIWLKQPGSLLEPDRLLGRDTTGYVAWTLRLEDPGTEQFVQDLLESMQRFSEQNQLGLHPALDSWLSGMQQRRNERKIRQMFPLAAAWTLRPGGAPGDDLHLFSVSLMRAGNQLVFWDWVLGLFLGRSPDVQVVEHRGEKIFRLSSRRDNPLAFFVRGNDLFFTSDVETAVLAVDRLATSGTGETAGAGLRELIHDVPPDAPLRGAVTNEGGELQRIWKQLDGAPVSAQVWQGLRGVTFSGGLLDGQSFKVRMGFRCADRARASASADEVARLLRSALEPAGFPMQLHAAPDGEWVRVDLELRELTSSMEKLLHAKTRGR